MDNSLVGFGADSMWSDILDTTAKMSSACSMHDWLEIVAFCTHQLKYRV